MDSVRVAALCRDACLALGLERPDLLGDDGAVEIEGIGIALRLDPEHDPGALSFYADLGRPAEDHRSQVYEQLMEINLLHGVHTCAVYAFDKDSGHLVACMRFDDAARLDSDFLARMLRFLAEEARLAQRVVEDPSQPMFEEGTAPSIGLGLNWA